MTLCMGFVSLLFATMAGVFPHAVLAFYTNDVAVQAEGARYIRIMALGYLFQTLCMACSSLLRSTENVKLPLVASLAAIATNTLLNWVLIYGNQMCIRDSARPLTLNLAKRYSLPSGGSSLNSLAALAI